MPQTQFKVQKSAQAGVDVSQTQRAQARAPALPQIQKSKPPNQVVDRLLLLTGYPTTELTPARTNMSFFNCLQQRNQTFQR